VNVSANIAYQGVALPLTAALVAHVHAGRCAASPPGGPHYLQSLGGLDDALDAAAPAGTPQGNNTLSVRVRSGGAQFSATQPFLADYDRALSLVLHEGAASFGYAPAATGARAACCDLVPNLPDMPDTWSATIECNFAEKGYTMVRQEFYSTALNKIAIVQHSNLARSVQVQDLSKNVTYSLSQNASFPNGLCVAQPIRPSPLVGTQGGKLQSTADFLQFDPTQAITFDGVGVTNVRGIVTERWSRNFSFAFGPDTSAGIASYYFPVSSWSNRGESFHRLIKRVEVNGTHTAANGSAWAFFHTYEFVNLVPAITNADVFNPCLVLQAGGLGTSRLVRFARCDAPLALLSALTHALPSRLRSRRR
jgi:hypothetical protein